MTSTSTPTSTSVLGELLLAYHKNSHEAATYKRMPKDWDKERLAQEDAYVGELLALSIAAGEGYKQWSKNLTYLERREVHRYVSRKLGISLTSALLMEDALLNS